MDDIRGMTARLAEDPSSLVFLELGEALRRRRQLEAALKVAQTGAARWPSLADAFDLLARVLVDLGDDAQAFEAWTTALELDASHAGANKGIGFLYYKVGDHAQTLRHLEAAQAVRPGDPGVEAALRRVRDHLAAPEQPAPAASARPTEPTSGAPAAPAAAASPTLPFAFEDEPASADTPQGAAASEAADAQVFAGLEGAESGLLLLDAKGMRLGGGLRSPAGEDVADAVAADLAGVSRDAARAAKLLGLGGWRTLAAESPDGSMLLVAPTPETVLLAVRDPSVPVGRLAYSVERAAGAARRWLEGLG